MTVQEIIISAMTREGVYKNVPNIFATSELLVQENIRVLNELLDDKRYRSIFVVIFTQ